MLGLFLTTAGCLGIIVDPGIDEIINTLMTKESCEEYSNEGALWFGDRCCVDIDNNKLCDDEVKPCENECNENDCKGRDWYHCVKDKYGCDVWVSQGKIVDKCGVECLDNSYCNDNEICEENNKCKKDWCGNQQCRSDEHCSTCPEDCGDCPPECGDGDCNGEENCLTCPSDCIINEEGKICCEENIIVGDCCNDMGCEGNMTCINNTCS